MSCNLKQSPEIDDNELKKKKKTEEGKWRKLRITFFSNMQNVLAIRSLFDAFLALSAGWFITLLVRIMLFLHPRNECMNMKSLLITSLFGAPQRYRPPAPRQQNRLQSSLSPREMCQCLCCSTGSRRVLRQKPSDSQSSPQQSETVKQDKQTIALLIIADDKAGHCSPSHPNPLLWLLLLNEDAVVVCAHAGLSEIGGGSTGRRGLRTWSRACSGPAGRRSAPSLLPSATNALTPRRLWASGQFFPTPTKTWPRCCRTLSPSSNFSTFDQTNSAGGNS